MRNARLLFVMMLLAVCFTALCACAAPQPTTPQQPDGATPAATPNAGVKQELTIPLDSVPTLDPQLLNAVPSYVAMKGYAEGLIRTFGGEVTPGVAERWEVAEDNLSMTFYLRKDACWSDGSPLTAHDFVYAFRRLANPATGAENSWAVAEIVNGEEIIYGDGSVPPEELGVEASDDYTFKIYFSTPAPYFLAFLDMPMFYPTKQEWVELHGEDYGTSADAILGNGPFVVSDFRLDEVIEMVPNENYWNREAIKLDKVTLRTVDAVSAFTLFETGVIDMCNVPIEIAPSYLADHSKLPTGTSITTYMSGGVDWFSINIASTTNPILGNKDFRLALNYALDREEYVQISSSGLYTPATRFVLPVVSGVNGYYADEYPLDVYKTTAELDKAREHLQNAMNAMGLSDPSQISIVITVGDNTPKAISENCKDQWERTLGIKVAIETVTYRAMLKNRVDGAFELVYAGWMPDYDDPYTYLGYFTSSYAHNGGKYSNPRYDELITTANNYPDAATRLSMYAEAEQILLEDAALIPLHVREIPYAIKSNLRNLLRFYLGSGIEYTYAYFE